MAHPYEILPTGLRLYCRLTPKSRLDAITGIVSSHERTALICTVRALPEKNKANTALVSLIAAWLNVPKSSVALAAGGKSRYKTLEIVGEPSVLQDAVEVNLARLNTESS